MKIFAVKEHEAYFNLSPSIELLENTAIPLPVHLESVVAGNPSAQKKLLELQQVFHTNNNGAGCCIQLKLTKIKDKVNVSPGSSVSCRLLRLEGTFLSELKEICDDVRVAVSMRGLRWPEARIYNSHFGDISLPDSYEGQYNITDVRINEMEVCEGNVCCEEEITLPEVWTRFFAVVKAHSPLQYGIRRYSIRISITVEISDQTPHEFSAVKRMLEESVETDAVLVAPCGSEIKCHKAFLAAQSTVLANNFRGDFRESKTGRIELVDMSKDAVVAFLEYLYYWGTEKPEKDSLVALELFQAGHKYNVSPLEKKMKLLLLAKKNEWYDVDVALRLFLFVKNVEGCEGLRRKSITVLKSKFKELQASEEYKTLFFKNPEAAMELCASAFSV